MIVHIPPEPPQLAPPGAGLPLLSRLAAQWFLLPAFYRKHSSAQAHQLFLSTGGKLADLAETLDCDHLGVRVLVPPLRGLEDSSRWWSAAMVLEHLMIVDALFISAIVNLSRGTVPAGRVGTAEVKPAGARDAAAVPAAFREFLKEADRRLSDRVEPLRADVRYHHPWFGPLTAHQWMCIAAIHHGIHLQQLKAVVAGLNPGA